MCAVLILSVVSDSLWPHGLWPVRLIWPWECSRQEYWNGLPCPPLGNLPNPRIQPRPPAWQPDSLPSESPGKHKVVVLNHPQLCEVKVAQSCLTLWDTMDYTVQARILEWVAFPFSRDLPDLGIEPRSPAFSSVQSLSRVWLFATPWTPARHASLSITNSWTLPKLMSIESVMPSNHLILCRPLLLLHSIFPRIRLFTNESALHIRWPKYWSFSFNISPSNGHPGLISFRMDWLDLLAVQETLKSLLQNQSSKASILQCSAFLIVQLSHSYMTTGKTIALIRWTFVGKVMSLLFNMLSILVIAFLPRSKCLLISWL